MFSLWKLIRIFCLWLYYIVQIWNWSKSRSVGQIIKKNPFEHYRSPSGTWFEIYSTWQLLFVTIWNIQLSSNEYSVKFPVVFVHSFCFFTWQVDTFLLAHLSTESKTRSPGLYIAKLCEHSRSHIFRPITMKFSQKVCLDDS